MEAPRLIGHYRVRAAMRTAVAAEPPRLRTRSERWAAPSSGECDPRYRERLLFVALTGKGNGRSRPLPGAKERASLYAWRAVKAKT